ncbi:MAG: hypothetical protein PGN13_13090 [Patulibacter minatonensis]
MMMPPGEAGPRRSSWPVGRAGAVGLAALAIVAWLLLPSAPGYDTATHLVWARELLAGRAADVNAAAAPTMHPLWLLLAVPAVATGVGGSLLQLLDLFALALVIACVWRLAADLAGRVAGAVAAVSVGSSFALLLLAFKAYVDLPFLALALLAVVFERGYVAPGVRRAAGGVSSSRAAGARALAALADRQAGVARQREVGPFVVPGLLFVAGLLRPEAWAFGLLFLFVRWLRGATIGRLWAPALVVLAAPVLWALADLVLSGDPLHSLTGTQQLAEALGRKTGLGNAPVELVRQLGDLARPPVAAAGVVGAALAVHRLGWRPMVVVVAPLLAGVAGFLLVGALGLPLLQRYLLVPAALLAVFAGVAAAAILATALGRELPGALGGAAPAGGDGSTSPADGGIGATPQQRPHAAAAPVPAGLRAIAALALVVGVGGAGGYVVLKAGSFRVLADGVVREATWQRQATELLEEHRAEMARDLRLVTLPTYRFVPELQLATGMRPTEIVSRARELGGEGPQTHGLALVIEGSKAARTRLGEAAAISRSTNTVPPGFVVVGRRGPFVLAAARVNDVAVSRGAEESERAVGRHTARASR